MVVLATKHFVDVFALSLFHSSVPWEMSSYLSLK